MATFFLLLIYITFISLGLPDSLLGAAWPAMRLDFAAPLDAAGVVTMVIAVGTIISSLASERMIRRFGTGRVTAVSVLLTAGALLGFSQSGGLLWLVVFAVPLGLGAGAVDAALNNYVALHYHARHMSWLHCFWGVGALTGPLIMGGFLGRGNNWQGGYLTIALIQFGVTALLFATLPLWNKKGITPPGGVTAETQAEAPAAGTGNVFRMPGVVLVMLTFALYCGVEAGVGLWGSSFLVESKGFAAPAAATAISVYYGSITVGRVFTGFLTARLSGTQLIRYGILVLLAGGAMLALPLPAAVAPVGLALIGLGCAPIYPSIIHETPWRFGAANSQRIIGFEMASAYCGTTFLPPLIGLLARQLGTYVLPVCVLSFALLMLLLSERLNRRLRRRAAQEG